MTGKHLVKLGIRYIREKGFKHFLWRFLHFILVEKNRHIENLNYLFVRIRNIRTDHIQITVNSNYLMYVDLKDKGISKELCVHKTREPFSTEFLQKFVKEEDIVIDIGANIGYYSLMEAQLANKGKVYAIEPIPTNVDLLKKNVELNAYKNIFVYQFAIGDKNGVGKMYIYDKCNWCSFIKNPMGNIVNEVKVPLMTLDTFVNEYVDQSPSFIRMDVEGYEYQIIRGAAKVLENKPLKLCIELHPHLMPRKNMVELLNILKQKGFEIKAIFVETSLYNYKDINIINKLRRKIGLPEFGFGGQSYEDLDKLVRQNQSCMVFFEK